MFFGPSSHMWCPNADPSWHPVASTDRPAAAQLMAIFMVKAVKDIVFQESYVPVKAFKIRIYLQLAVCST